jgi:hypothetical protein
LNPRNGMVSQAEDEVLHSARFSPIASKSPPIQTCPLESSQYSVSTSPDTPEDNDLKDPEDNEYEAMFAADVPDIEVNRPPINSVPSLELE